MEASERSIQDHDRNKQLAPVNGFHDLPLLHERMGIDGFPEDLRNRVGLNNNIGDEYFRHRLGLGLNIDQRMQSTLPNSNLDKEQRNQGNLNGSQDKRVTYQFEEELRKTMGFSNSGQKDTDFHKQNRQENNNFYEADLKRDETSTSDFHNKTAENTQQNDEKTEPNSKHLDECIDAVARNEFDYNPEEILRRSELRRTNFMEHFQIKQEPIDYDTMAANLTAGLMNPDRRHMCPHCCKGFRSRQQLLQHSLVHSNLRKYHCTYCERSFKQLSHLHQHHRIHTGEKPYTCPLPGCDKSFPQLSNLQHHIRNHDKLAESQFQCHLCDRAYPNEATLKAHNTRMHVHSKLIADLQKSPQSHKGMPVSQPPSVSNFQPRQRKRKASRPQHINDRSTVPFSHQDYKMYSQIMNNLMKEKGQGQEDYVYILDSDDDESPSNIPDKKPELPSSNGYQYGNNSSQKNNFHNSKMFESQKSKSETFKESDKQFASHLNERGYQYVDDLSSYPPTACQTLPRLPEELYKEKNHVTKSTNEMIKNNANESFSSNEMFGNRDLLQSRGSNIIRNDHSALTNEMQRDINQRTQITNEIQREISQRSQMTNEVHRDTSQRSQLTNKMQHYNESLGLDLSTNNNEFSYEQNGGRYQRPRTFMNNTHNAHRIQQNISENEKADMQRMYLNRMQENSANYDQIYRNINGWQGKNPANHRRLGSGELEFSSDDSDSEIENQHFQTPNLGAEVYDDPMN